MRGLDILCMKNRRLQTEGKIGRDIYQRETYVKVSSSYNSQVFYPSRVSPLSVT